MKRVFTFISLISILTMVLSACSTIDNSTGTQQTSSQNPGIGSSQVSPKDGMKMMYVPAGDFQMGDAYGINASPKHNVFLDAYWIDITPITNAMFAEFVKETNYQTEAEKSGWSTTSDGINASGVQGLNWQHPQSPSSDLSGLDSYPVVHMSWNDADAYCKWAGRSLPTEAQWEKAARGIDTRIYPWGNDPPAGTRMNYADKSLSFGDQSVDDGFLSYAPVGSFPDGASPYGVLDMAGNVYQWTSDWYDTYFYLNSPAKNPTGSETGTTKIIRGGTYLDLASGNLITNRRPTPPNETAIFYGFRCALEDVTAEENLAMVPNSTQVTRPSEPAPVVPDVSAPISIQNVSQLTRLTSMGEGDLISIQLSPDEKWVVLNSSTGVLVMDSLFLKKRLFLPTEMKPKEVSFLEGGSKLSARDCFQGYIWSFPDGREISHVHFAQSIPGWLDYWGCNVVPDNNWVDVFKTSQDGQKPGLYNIDSGEAIFTTEETPWNVVFSPDNELIAYNTNEKLIILQHQDGKVLQEISEKGIRSLFFYPDGKTLGAVFETQTKFWNIADYKLLEIVTGTGKAGGETNRPVFSLDNSLLVFRSDEAFRLYRALDRKYISTVLGNGIRFTPDNQDLLVDSGKGEINYYSISEDRSRIELKRTIPGRGLGDVYSGKNLIPGPLSNDKTRLITARTTGNLYSNWLKQIVVSNLSDGSMISIETSPMGTNLLDAVWLPQKQTYGIIIGGSTINSEFDTLDLNSRTLTKYIGEVPYAFNSAISFSPGSDLLVFVQGNQLISWDIKNSGFWQLPVDQPYLSYAIAGRPEIRFSEDGRTIYYVDPVKLTHVYNSEDYEFNGQAIGQGDPFGTKKTPSPDGKYSVSMENEYMTDSQKATVFDKDGNLLYDLTGRLDMDFAISADSKMIAISTFYMSGNKVSIFDLATGKELFTTGDGFSLGGLAPKIAFSPDGKYLAILPIAGNPQLWGIP